jgi:diguanylate cyclase (GGDEF)-like protein
VADSTALQGILVRFARTLPTDYDIDEALHGLIADAAGMLQPIAIGVMFGDDQGKLQFLSAPGDDISWLDALQAKLGEGPCLSAYRTGTQVSVPDLRSQADFPTFAPRARAAGMAAIHSFPIGAGGDCVGAVNLYARFAGTLSAEDLAAGQVLADIATGYVIGARDRQHARQAQQELETNALCDTLTGLGNRPMFMNRLRSALAAQVRHGTQLAVLFLGLDRFKLVNGSLGHESGDQVLREMARRLRAVVRPGDLVARFGADEFAVLGERLPATEAQDVAVDLAERILATLAVPFVLDQRGLVVTASIGVSLSHAKQDAETLVGQADTAMYRAKSQGKARLQVFDTTMQAGARTRLQAEADLRGATERGELRLDYQPILDATDGGLVAVEALLRWQHPLRGLCAPDQFIGLAEETGMIVEIGRWALEEACRQAARWSDMRPAEPPLQVSVNLSPRQIGIPLLDTVSDALSEMSAPPESLCLEITEGVLISDAEASVSVLHALKTLGVNIALDDFGTGYSSLAYLQRFPIDVLKVDRSFIHDLGREQDRAIVRAMIGLAHSLGIPVVAEGVETAEQLDYLQLLGCDQVQGYLLGRPRPARRIDERLASPAGYPIPLGTFPTGAGT